MERREGKIRKLEFVPSLDSKAAKVAQKETRESSLPMLLLRLQRQERGGLKNDQPTKKKCLLSATNTTTRG